MDQPSAGELSADAFVFSSYVETTKPCRPDNVTWDCTIRLRLTCDAEKHRFGRMSPHLPEIRCPTWQTELRLLGSCRFLTRTPM